MRVLVLSIILLSKTVSTQESYRKVVVVDLKKKQWSALLDGKKIRTGKANGGSKKCLDTGLHKCRTPIGEWKVIQKYGPVKRSNLYPLNCNNKKKCGFPMLWFMKFHPNGTGLHGVKRLTGRNTSHGCVRLTREDAKWLNTRFVEKGTTVRILEY